MLVLMTLTLTLKMFVRLGLVLFIQSKVCRLKIKYLHLFIMFVLAVGIEGPTLPSSVSIPHL